MSRSAAYREYTKPHQRRQAAAQPGKYASEEESMTKHDKAVERLRALRLDVTGKTPHQS
jgi:hypothetical protein